MTAQTASLVHRANQPSPERSKSAGVWLTAVAVMIAAMVIVGGATRITGSGLSITEWRPVSGVIPPLSHRAWDDVFALYRQTPQYRLLNRGMSLAQFQGIFWWEWAHRLLGRLIGVVFLVPFLVLVAARRLPKRLIWRCAILFALGGVQGGVGWWMVKSGLEARTSVAPERLAAHLGLALLLMCACVWTALEAWFGPRSTRRSGAPRLSAITTIFLVLIFVQCLLGALVAGNHAGLVDADWPLMGGRLIPRDYWAGSVWGTIAHNAPSVQFDHRLLAYALLAIGVTLAIACQRLRGLAWALAAMLLAQAALGIATLLLTVPLPLALAHQFVAAGLIGLATALAWRARRV